MTLTAVEFASHIRWCQLPANRADWTRPDDLRLVEGMISRGAERTAADLRRLQSACLWRWNQLYPAEFLGIDTQVTLLRLLRAPAGEGL